MSKHYLLLFLIIILLMLSDQLFAESYAVRIAVSDRSLVNDYQDLDIYGDLYSVIDDNGNVLTALGPFKNKANAQDAFNELRVLGHPDLVIIDYQVNVLSTENRYQNNASIKDRYESNKVKVEDVLDKEKLEAWNRLTPQQRSNITYIDGQLKIKQGDKYIDFD